MGKTRDLFKRIRDTKGTFHATMGTIKDRNSMDLTEAEAIKKTGKNTQKKYTRKILMMQITTMGVITYLEPDISECESKWTLGSITTNKASGGDGIPTELFQILKDNAMKVLYSICQQIGKLSNGHKTGKGKFSFQCQGKAIPKNAQITKQLHSSHMIAK